MAFNESLTRLDKATLELRVAPTRVSPYSAMVADNVEFYPRATISKRPGYRRREDLQMAHPVTAFLEMDGKRVFVGGDVDAL